MSCLPYQNLLREREALLRRINPQGDRFPNCPETADTLNDYLTTGTERRVRAASSVATFNLPRVTWRSATLAQIAARLSNCSHVVVRGTRTNPARTLTPDHYFVLFKVNDVVYAADAMTHELSDDIANYIAVDGPNDRMTRFAYSSNFNVTISDPLAGL